jgi:hypothetical protein
LAAKNEFPTAKKAACSSLLGRKSLQDKEIA